MATTRVNLTIDTRTLSLVQREAESAGVSLSAWVTAALRDAAVRSDAARLGQWVSRHAETHETWRTEAEFEADSAEAHSRGAA